MIYEPASFNHYSIDTSPLDRVDKWLWKTLDWDHVATRLSFEWFGKCAVYCDANRILFYQGRDTYLELLITGNRVRGWNFIRAAAGSKYVPELLIGKQVIMENAKAFGVCTVMGYDAELKLYRVKPHDPKFCFGGLIEWSARLDELSVYSA